MICLQQFYNIFTTNLKWQIVIGCYCWVKKVISVRSQKWIGQREKGLFFFFPGVISPLIKN